MSTRVIFRDLLPFALVASIAPGAGAQVNLGNAFTLDGIDDRALVPNTDGYLEPAAFTFECWVKRAEAVSPGGRNRVFMARNNNGWGVYYEAGNNIRLTSTGISDVASSVAINDTLWHHIAVSHDGTTARFHHDGVLTDVIPYATTFNSMMGDYAIGDRQGFGEYLTGSVDELRVWNTVRTEQEIQANYCAEVDPASPGLILYYRMNEAQGASLLADLAPGNHPALIQNNNGSIVATPAVLPCTPNSVAENGADATITVHPNPWGGGPVTLDLPAALAGEAVALRLVDATGRCVWDHRALSSGALRVEWPALPPGSYLLQARSADRVYVGRVLVQ
jgi:hypothetical protein